MPGGSTVSYENGRAGAGGVPIIEAVTTATSTTGYIDHDAGGTPEVITTDAGVEEYYVLDGTVGSPVALIRTNGQQGGAYSYDPYGTYTTTDNSTAAAGLNPARFAGGTYDRTTGNLHYGARWYDPTLGSWTQQDTINAPLDLKTANRYAYAADDPTNNIDPAGSFPCGSISGCVSDVGNGISDASQYFHDHELAIVTDVAVCGLGGAVGAAGGVAIANPVLGAAVGCLGGLALAKASSPNPSLP